MNNIYYCIQDRGYMWMQHWFTYMVGGLRHIKTDTYPIKIFFSKTFMNTDFNFQQYHLETFELIKDKYIVENPNNNSIVISNYGEPTSVDKVDPATNYFLRDLFLSRINLPDFDENSLIYITRKNSHILNPGNEGISRRQVLNEYEIIPELEKLGFKFIQLEDYSLEEKIKLFYKSRIIISPNSGGLTMSLFANKKTKIIEIMPENVGQYDWYKNICNDLNISFERYSNVNIIGNYQEYNGPWNFTLDKNHFIEWVKSKL